MGVKGDINEVQINTNSFKIPRWLMIVSTKCEVWYGSTDCSNSDEKTMLRNQYGRSINIFISILKHTQDWQTERSLNIWIPQTL